MQFQSLKVNLGRLNIAINNLLKLQFSLKYTEKKIKKIYSYISSKLNYQIFIIIIRDFFAIYDNYIILSILILQIGVEPISETRQTGERTRRLKMVENISVLPKEKANRGKKNGRKRKHV